MRFAYVEPRLMPMYLKFRSPQQAPSMLTPMTLKQFALRAQVDSPDAPLFYPDGEFYYMQSPVTCDMRLSGDLNFDQSPFTAVLMHGMSFTCFKFHMHLCCQCRSFKPCKYCWSIVQNTGSCLLAVLNFWQHIFICPCLHLYTEGVVAVDSHNYACLIDLQFCGASSTASKASQNLSEGCEKHCEAKFDMLCVHGKPMSVNTCTVQGIACSISLLLQCNSCTVLRSSCGLFV